MPGDILQQIDDSLEAWERESDAARWEGAPKLGEWEDDPTDPHPVELMQRVELATHVSTEQIRAAFAELVEIVADAMARATASLLPALQMIHAGLRAIVQEYDQKPRPRAAADRTNSPRKRAGMRRTKHQARKQNINRARRRR